MSGARARIDVFFISDGTFAIFIGYFDVGHGEKKLGQLDFCHRNILICYGTQKDNAYTVELTRNVGYARVYLCLAIFG